MEITTTCRRYEIEPGINDLAEKRIQKLERYFDNLQEAHLVLAQEKYRFIAELSLHGAGLDLTSRQQENSMAASIDKVCDRVERQLKKHAARVKRRQTAPRTVPANVIVHEQELAEVEVEDEYSPVVVRMDNVSKEPISVEDAISLLREKDWDQVLFPNSRSGKVALLFMRPDGNFGLTETE
ncbi:MAG: ribosome-associated translation inhibitor RaiA [Candidatus Eisenbacteria bacterium]|nr:ribosome-associated translation inhibitor RaiA [Candidatus Eisenbacteria bacterium]